MNLWLPILYLVALNSAFMSGFFALNVRRPSGKTQPLRLSRLQLPRATLGIFMAITLPSILQGFFPVLLGNWQRDTARIVDGEWWRLATALFVQDGGAAGALFNLIYLPLLGAVAELLLGSGAMLFTSFCGGICSEIVALFWQPSGAGNSVVNFALSSAIAVGVLAQKMPYPLRIAACLSLGVSGILLALHNIHGVAALIGALLALLLARRSIKI